MKYHLFYFSGGKDSTSSLILFHEHERELLADGDKVIILFSQIMFDKRSNIPAHTPEMTDFVYEKKKIFESWGYEFHILRADKDYLDIFYHKLTRSPNKERVGMTHGFIRSGICSVKRDLKIKPMNDFLKELREKCGENDSIIEYLGFAKDEKERMDRLHRDGTHVSLLERYGLSESDARELCIKYDMLSPHYSLRNGEKFQGREGCIFCPNARLAECRSFRNRYREAWDKLVSLEDEPNLAYDKWSPWGKETLHDRDKLLREECRQLSIFDFMGQEVVNVCNSD